MTSTDACNDGTSGMFNVLGRIAWSQVAELNWSNFPKYWCARSLCEVLARSHSRVFNGHLQMVFGDTFSKHWRGDVQWNSTPCCKVLLPKGPGFEKPRNPRKLLHDWFISWPLSKVYPKYMEVSWPLSKVYGGFLRWFFLRWGIPSRQSRHHGFQWVSSPKVMVRLQGCSERIDEEVGSAARSFNWSHHCNPMHVWYCVWASQVRITSWKRW